MTTENQGELRDCQNQVDALSRQVAELRAQLQLAKRDAVEESRKTHDALHHFEKQKDYILELQANIRELVSRIANIETNAPMIAESAPTQAPTAYEMEVFKIAVAASIVARRKVLDAGLPVSKKNSPVDLLKKSLLFDPQWYLEHYGDVRAEKMNPIEHYVKCGAVEGRDPGPLFSTSFYLKNNPNVAKTGINPLVHFESEGYKPLVGL